MNEGSCHVPNGVEKPKGKKRYSFTTAGPRSYGRRRYGSLWRQQAQAQSENYVDQMRDDRLQRMIYGSEMSGWRSLGNGCFMRRKIET